MPIESGTTISELDSLWPLSGDFILEGDNHLRLIKAVLKAQFPGAGAQGFSQPITASEQEINYLGGATSNIQDQIDALTIEYQGNLYAPSGTVMIFFQAAPPVGWSQIKNNNNSMLRVVDNNVGQAGGSDDPVSLVQAAHKHTTAGHTLTIAQMPSHSHTRRMIEYRLSVDDKWIWAEDHVNNNDGNTQQDRPTSTVGGGGSHSHGDTGNAGAISFKPRYINVMTAVKD